MSVTSSRIGNLRLMLPIRNWISQASVSHRLYAMGVVIGLMYIRPFVVLGVLRIQQFLLFALSISDAAHLACGLQGYHALARDSIPTKIIFSDFDYLTSFTNLIMFSYISGNRYVKIRFGCVYVAKNTI